MPAHDQGARPLIAPPAPCPDLHKPAKQAVFPTRMGHPLTAVLKMGLDQAFMAPAGMVLVRTSAGGSWPEGFGMHAGGFGMSAIAHPFQSPNVVCMGHAHKWTLVSSPFPGSSSCPSA
jgi:hypothetical protein